MLDFLYYIYYTKCATKSEVIMWPLVPGDRKLITLNLSASALGLIPKQKQNFKNTVCGMKSQKEKLSDVEFIFFWKKKSGNPNNPVPKNKESQKKR